MSVQQKEHTKIFEIVKEPRMYCCVVHNDDVTTMDFVVMALCEVFQKTSYEATRLTTYIHHHGSARIGRYCYDIALSKKHGMDALARVHNFPLRTTVEEAGAE